MDDLAYFPPGTETFVGCLPSGLRVRWYERGPKADGQEGPSRAPTVLCLHGFPELAVSWRDQVEALSDQYRVVAPDMRGFGGTDAPPRIRDYTIDLLARDVSQLIDALGVRRVHLVGHDWGGAIAWEVAQRFGDQLSSLTVLNCPPYQIMLRELRRPEQLRRSWYMFFFQLPYIAQWRMKQRPEVIADAILANAYNKEVFTPERLEPFVRQARERSMVGGINYYRAALLHLPRRRVAISVPTRLIWGLRDPALGPYFAEEALYRSWVERFDRVLLDDVGHFPQQEAAEQVNAALREHFERSVA